MIKALSGVRVVEQGTFITGPCCGMMLADPEILEAEFLAFDGKLEILIEALRQGLVGVVHRHDEHAE